MGPLLGAPRARPCAIPSKCYNSHRWLKNGSTAARAVGCRRRSLKRRGVGPNRYDGCSWSDGRRRWKRLCHRSDDQSILTSPKDVTPPSIADTGQIVGRHLRRRVRRLPPSSRSVCQIVFLAIDVNGRQYRCAPASRTPNVLGRADVTTSLARGKEFLATLRIVEEVACECPDPL
jgi:hypothetical protein